MWIKISSKSKKRIVKLMNPQAGIFDIDFPRKLTIRRLMHRKQFEKLRSATTIAKTIDGHLVCLANLKREGFDWCG